jgi:ketosteroid isomerase-like protein
MRSFLCILSITTIFCCNTKTEETTVTGNYSALEILAPNETPTVDIEKYVLISHSNDVRKSDASEILAVKRKWPLAMQSPSIRAFDSLLSKDFVFAADGQLLNRKDYINDRTSSSEWKITHVKYDNMALQFFGDIALLTYRNQVKNENINTNAVEIEYMSWADVYNKEEGKWKIDAAHVVDYRVEKK